MKLSSVKKKITVCGMGPGSRDYVLPCVFDIVAKSDLIIAGKRHIEMVHPTCRFVYIGSNMQLIYDEIVNCKELNITVLVSGDTGFYSAFGALKKNIPDAEYTIYPGISSYQYFFAKIGKTYESAFLGSIHGIDIDLVQVIESYSCVFLLTDTQRTWKSIAETLVNGGFGKYVLHVANRLSYPDEIIISARAEELLTSDYDFNLCAVIIEKND